MSTDGKKAATEVGDVVASQVSDLEKDTIRRQQALRYRDPYYGRYDRNQPGSQFYDPTTSTPYYGMTQKPMRGRDTAIFAGLGLLGTGIERYLRGQEADTAGVRYAEQQLAQAQADLKAPTPKMSSEEKADMVQAAVAPVRTEIEEIKSDVGSYLASTGRTASVEDVVAAREVGTQALADAPIHAAAVAADKDLKMLQMDEAKKAAAQARADNMVAVLDKVELQQMKYDQAMWGDITKVAFTATANAVAQDNRPAVDRLLERGASMQDLQILHQKAVAAGYPQGSREYNNYMMKEYHGLTSKKKTGKVKKADSAEVTAPSKPFGRPVSSAKDASDRLKDAATVPGKEVNLTDRQIRSLGKKLAAVATTVTSQSPGTYYPLNVMPGLKFEGSSAEALSRNLESDGYNPDGFDYYEMEIGKDDQGRVKRTYFAVSKGDPKPDPQAIKIGSEDYYGGKKRGQGNP